MDDNRILVLLEYLRIVLLHTIMTIHRIQQL